MTQPKMIQAKAGSSAYAALGVRNDITYTGASPLLTARNDIGGSALEWMIGTVQQHPSFTS
jgi:hypothetical protein